MNIVEWWAIDENGDKYHDYMKTKHSRNSKIKAQIKKEYGVDPEKCIDFGLRLLDDE